MFTIFVIVLSITSQIFAPAEIMLSNRFFCLTLRSWPHGKAEKKKREVISFVVIFHSCLLNTFFKVNIFLRIHTFVVILIFKRNYVPFFKSTSTCSVKLFKNDIK